MAGLIATPSKVDKEVPFQPVIYARDGTPRRTLPVNEYEQRKQLCTSQFLQKVQADHRQPKAYGQPARSGQGFQWPGWPAAAGVAVAVVAVIATGLGGVHYLQPFAKAPVAAVPGAAWATSFLGQQEADWSFGCSLQNISQDKAAGLVSFTAHFADLPADVFASGSLQVPFAAVFGQQLVELGDYAFNASEVSLTFSNTQPSLDTNVTLGSPQQLIVFISRVSQGGLAGRLAANLAFRRVLTDAGYKPKVKASPAAIKGSWLEPLMESTTKTQEEASLGMLRYMHEVQRSYAEVHNKLVESEAREEILKEQLQAKTSVLEQAERKTAKLQKELDAKASLLDTKAKDYDKVKVFEGDALKQLDQLKGELATARKDLAAKDKLLVDKDKQVTEKERLLKGLQVQHKEAVDKLQIFQGDKSQLAEKYDALSREKEQKEKQLASVSTKLQKVLVDNFNITADKAAKPDVLVGTLEKQFKQWKGESKASVDKLQSEMADVKSQLEKEKIRSQADLKKAEDKYAAALAQKEKDAAAALAAAESSVTRSVESATKSLQAEARTLHKDLSEAKKEHTALQQKLEAAQQQLQDKDTRVQDLKKQNKALSDEKSQVSKELASSIKSRDSWQSQADSYKSELGNTISKLLEATATNQSQEKIIKRLEQMLYKLLGTGKVLFDDVGRDFEDYRKGLGSATTAAAPPAPAAAEVPVANAA